MSSPVLAIDFGTSASSATLVTGEKATDRPVENKSPQFPTRHWPSAVCWKDGRMLVGTEAEEAGQAMPWNYRREFKRLLGSPTPIVLGGREFMAADLVKLLLEALRAQAEGPSRTVRRGVLTVPPSYVDLGDERADLMIRAGLDAGFTEGLELLPEPVAAAMANPARQPFAPGGLVLVYDFGGGTFDTALVTIGTPDADRRIPSMSLDNCGGSDIDTAICDWLLKRDNDMLPGLLTARTQYGLEHAVNRAFMDLLARANWLTRRISEGAGRAAATLYDVELTLELDEFREIVAPWIAMTVRCCRDLMKAEDIPQSELAGILLVGGASQTAGVREALEREFGRQADGGPPIVQAEDPRSAVVDGAAEFARMAPYRRIDPVGSDPQDRFVGWPIPGGVAKLLHWRVAAGASYGPGDELGAVRLPTGEVYELRTGPQDGGIVRSVHASPGQPVRSGDRLLTVARPFRPWLAGRGITDSSPFAAVSPAVSGGRVFCSTTTGVAEARVAATGDLCWRRDLRSEVTAPATVAGGLVYFGCKDGTVHMLDEQTGLPRDSLATAGKAVKLPTASRAIKTAPLVVAGQVCVGSDDGQLYVFRPGQPPAAVPVGPRVRATVVSGGVIYVLAHGEIHALDAATLSPLAGWQRPVGVRDRQPVVADGRLYACFDDDTIRGLDPRAGRQLARWPPTQEAPEPEGRGAQARALFKEATRRLPIPAAAMLTTPVVFASGADGVPTVYVGTADGRIVALFADSLGQRNEQQAGPVGAELTSLAVADGAIYAGSADGGLHALTTAGAELTSLWHSAPTGLGPVRATPVVAEGIIFAVTDAGYLDALDAATGERGRPGR